MSGIKKIDVQTTFRFSDRPHLSKDKTFYHHDVDLMGPGKKNLLKHIRVPARIIFPDEIKTRS